MKAMVPIEPGFEGGLPPVCGSAPRVLVLGSFPSVISLRDNRYYGNPQNRFWHIMEDLFSVNRMLPYDQRLDLVQRAGIALWDVIGSCSREGSSDSRIKNPVFNDIGGFVASRPTLALIALNGSTAARYFQKAGWKTGADVVVLPSTSPANARIRYTELLDSWTVLKNR